jgi:hypothetical protein
VRTPGRLPSSVYTRGPRGAEAVVDPECPPGSGACNPYHVFDPALRLFPSGPLREFVLAQADHGGAGLCQAYDLTGDPKYAAAALAGLLGVKTTIGTDRVLCFYDFSACDELPRRMKTVALAAAADPDGFWEYARRWRDQRAQADAAASGKPSKPEPEQYPLTSLGVLSTEPFAE